MDVPPYPLPYDYGNAFYAYTYGPVRHVMINAYTDMSPRSTQYKWLVKEFKAIDRRHTPWVIVVIHVPLYSTWSLHRHDLQIVAAKEHLEPLFVEYGVNIVISGHIHAYLRTHPVIDGVVDSTGPVHITVGAGGRKCEAPFRNSTAEEWVAVRDATVYGYGLLEVTNASLATWHWIHTGFNEKRTYNQVWKSDENASAGPGRDTVILRNNRFK
jgi:acid phosphatase type 7